LHHFFGTDPKGDFVDGPDFIGHVGLDENPDVFLGV
jgi:hypothetical protein